MITGSWHGNLYLYTELHTTYEYMEYEAAMCDKAIKSIDMTSKGEVTIIDSHWSHQDLSVLCHGHCGQNLMLHN